MKVKLFNLSIYIIFLIPILYVFRFIFTSSTAVWGDAPYFYQQGLVELVSEPHIWTNRGINFGGLQLGLWIYPLTFVYGLFGFLLNLGNSFLIKTIFYLPALVFSIAGSYLLTKSIFKSHIIIFFSSFFYVLNTYFLLLVDGGQVGVALAYGLFPLSLWSFRTWVEGRGFSNVFICLVINTLLSFADFRIFLLSIFTFIVWVLISPNFLNSKTIFRGKKFATITVAILTLNSFWIFPLLSSGNSNLIDAGISINEKIPLHYTLSLFQPHWSNNILGVIDSMPLYFLLFPFLIILGVLLGGLKNTFRLLILYLLFAFLAKGAGEPFGVLYRELVDNTQYGTAFRDSTKFYIPLILVGGILVSKCIFEIYKLIKQKALKVVFLGISYLLFLIMILPAFTNQLHGVFSSSKVSKDYLNIKDYLVSQKDFFRVIWVPERSPFSYQDKNIYALDGRSLIEKRPFSQANQGNDPYNFLLHDKEVYTDLMQALGIKYVILSGEQRNKLKQEDFERLQDVESSLKLNSALESIVLEGVNYPIYKLSNSKPNFFTVDRMYMVVGSDNIYKKIKNINQNFNIESSGFIFVEDGKFDPKNINNLSPENLQLIFNDKQKEDLIFSYLARFFIREPKASQWYLGKEKNYLQWKYEILQKGVEVDDFDYGRGVMFSSIPGEEIIFNLDSKTRLNTLGIRYAGKAGSKIKIIFDNKEYVLEIKEDGVFRWFKIPDISLPEGINQLVIENLQGVGIINVVALIPQDDWNQAEAHTLELTQKYGESTINNFGNFKQLSDTTHDVLMNKIGTNSYQGVGEKGKWIIFNDNFSKSWKLKNSANIFEPLPIYSMINGFYLGKDGKFDLYYQEQEKTRWGLYLAGVTILVGTAFLLVKNNEAPRSDDRGIFSPLLRREQNPSEAETHSHSSASLRSQFSAKGDKS